MKDRSEFRQLLAIMDRSALDAVALIPGPNFRRLLGREFHLMERPFVLLIRKDGYAAAVVPNLEMASFATLGFDGEVFDWRDEAGFEGAFDAAAHSLGNLPVIGVEGQRMRVFEYLQLLRVFPQSRMTDAHQGISSIRLAKSAEEIDRIRAAIRISERSLEATLGQIRVGQSEKEIEAILLREMFAHGADGIAFHPIVAAADNSAQPHAEARADYFIKEGDALLIDFGASLQGYHADITRTFFVRSVSDHDRAFYETVLAANERGRAVSKSGLSAHDVDDAVQRVLEQSQFAAFARHKTGHGLGLEVHEAPQIMRGNSAILQPGMVYTIEPGLYREGECGVRIEDDVVVTENGIECLTGFPRDLRLVG